MKKNSIDALVRNSKGLTQELLAKALRLQAVGKLDLEWFNKCLDGLLSAGSLSATQYFAISIYFNGDSGEAIRGYLAEVCKVRNVDILNAEGLENVLAMVTRKLPKHVVLIRAMNHWLNH